MNTMNYPKLIFKKISIVASFSLLLICSSALAQSVSIATDPVGYTSFDLYAGSDNYISLPLIPSPVGANILSINPTVENSSTATLSVESSHWNADEFASFFYVRMTSGVPNGRYYPITTNTSNTLTIDLNGDDFSEVVAGNSFRIHKFWTLAEAFIIRKASSISGETSFWNNISSY